MRVAEGVSTTLTYLHGDHLGSTSLATYGSGPLEGQEVPGSRTGYYPFGETRYGGAAPTDYGFTGQRQEAGFGLYDYNARYYDPYLNRFVSPDTIVPDPANPQSLNRYAYVRNNPLRYVDPSGHIEEDQYDDAIGIINDLQDNYDISIDVDFGWDYTLSVGPRLGWIKGAWQLRELEAVESAVGRYREASGSSDAVRSALGGTRIAESDEWFHSDFDTISLTTSAMPNRTQLENEATIAHELAHRWDFKWGLTHRIGLTLSTIGEPGPTNYARDANYFFAPIDQMAEDWAVSVEAYLYPEWLAMKAALEPEQVTEYIWHPVWSWPLPFARTEEVEMPQLLPRHRQYVEAAFN